MKPEIVEYVRYRLERAHQAANIAQISLERGFLNDAVNRMYYACFYAVTALLIIEGLNSKTHIGVRTLFDKHFVKTGRFPREMSKFYHDVLTFRIMSDYKDFVTFVPEDVHGWLLGANKFITAVTQEAKQLLPDQELD